MSQLALRRQGGEFRVNATTAGNQLDASVTALAGGGYVLSWTDSSRLGGDASGTAVRAQVYAADGTAQGAELLVNSAAAGNQERSALTGLADGGFVAVWTDFSLTAGDASGGAIRAQRYDATGARLGGELLVNATTAGTQTDAATAALAGGGFVVTWTDASATGGDRSGSAIRGQRYDAAGVRLGSEFLVNTTTHSDQSTSTVAALAGGGFVVAWADHSRTGGDTSGFAIRAQLHDSSGARLGPELQVNSSTANNQTAPVVTTLASGRFVVAWTDFSLAGDPAGASIKAQLFNGDGSRAGGELLVNTTLANNQIQPSVAALPGGGFAISWADNSIRLADYSGYAVRTQLFTDDGAKAGAEFVANRTTQGNQDAPVMAALASGALVIAWTDASQQGGDASGTGVRAQMFAPNTGTISDIALSALTFSEASAQHTVVAALSADGAENALYTYELLDDSTGGGFRIVDGRLVVEESLRLDFELAPFADLTVRASDSFGNSFVETIRVQIENALRESRFAAGPETRVNAQVAGDQLAPTVARLESGGFVVSWIDGSLQGGDASGFSVKAQLYDDDGFAVGGERLVNTTTTGNQNQPSVGALSDGGFVIAWSTPVGGGGLGTVIAAQRFDAAGARLGGEFVVSDAGPAQSDAAVTGLADGGFVVSWSDFSGQHGDASGAAAVARAFDASGAPLGPVFLLNEVMAAGQDQTAITALGSGGFVAIWRDASGIGGDASSSGIKGRLFDAAGVPAGPEFLVNTETRSAQLQPAATALAGGGFVVTWTDNSNVGGDLDYYGVKAQLFGEDGVRIGGELLVNTATANAQQNPVVAPLTSGGFLVSWFDFSGAGGELGSAGVRAQAFNAQGARLGAEISVNAQTLGAQGDPAVVGLASGAFAIAYSDLSGAGGDPVGAGIKLRLFTPLLDPGAPPLLRAVDDSFTGVEEQARTILAADLLANDANGNAGILSLAGVTSVSGGSVAFDAEGNVVFTSAANFDGRAFFDYVLEDGTGASDTGRVFIDVAGTQDPPTANPDTVFAAEDGTTSFAALTANDVDPDRGDRLTVIAIPATTSGGTPLTLVNGVVGFVAGQRFQSLRAGETVTETFAYTISDLAGATSGALVTVIVQGANDAPAGLALSAAAVDENAPAGAIVGDLSAFDPDAGDSLAYALTGSAGGRFTVDAATGRIVVAAGAVLDFEAAASHVVTARATDSAGAFTEVSFTIAVNNQAESRSYNGDNGANRFTAPTADYWTISGNGGNDTLTGNALADTIFGGSGADTVDGGGGADMLFGGTGNDTLVVDDAGDVVVEAFGEGVDIVHAWVSHTLPQHVENLLLLGAADLDATGNDFNNTMTGNSGRNRLDGGLGRDFLVGGDGDDLLIGSVGGDWLNGGAGTDELRGGAGIDELTGGTEADRFVFEQFAAEIDLVRDFAPGLDQLVLSVAGFDALAGDPLGELAATRLAIGAAATTAEHRLVYNPGTGALSYDADGVGGAAAVQFARFSTNPVLDAASIVLIA